MATTAIPAPTARTTSFCLRRMHPTTVRQFFDLCDGIARRNGNRAARKRILALVSDDVTLYNRCHQGKETKQHPDLYGQYAWKGDQNFIYINPTRSTMQQYMTLAHEYAHHHTSGGAHNKAFRRMYAMFLVALAITLQTNIDMDVEIARCADRYVAPQCDTTPGGYWSASNGTNYTTALKRATALARQEMHHAADKVNGWFSRYGYSI